MVGIKTIKDEAITPGIDKGRIILKNWLKVLSPKSLDASSKDLSIFSKETKIGNIAKGAQPCTSASTTALELYNKKVKGSVITPSHSKKEFKTPLYPNITFHKNILNR